MTGWKNWSTGNWASDWIFPPANKWYMHKPEFVIENETHGILWDFEVHTDHPIPARRQDLILIKKNKRTCHSWTSPFCKIIIIVIIIIIIIIIIILFFVWILHWTNSTFLIVTQFSPPLPDSVLVIRYHCRHSCHSWIILLETASAPPVFEPPSSSPPPRLNPMLKSNNIFPCDSSFWQPISNEDAL